MDSSTYGERIADRYDHEHRFLGSTSAQVELLAGLAAPGLRALELGVGTGRVAIPLAERGIAVTGIDSSPKMLAKLAEKPGGDKVRTVLGDMQEIAVDGPFDLVYVVFNTFFGLVTPEAQIECLTRAAARLAPEGKLLIEAFVPDVTRFTAGQVFRTVSVREDTVVVEASRHDPITQLIESSLLYLTQGRPVDLVPMRIRYAYVAELDLMARVAGLSLHARWAGWKRERFGSGATQHVSVYSAQPTVKSAP